MKLLRSVSLSMRLCILCVICVTIGLNHAFISSQFDTLVLEAQSSAQLQLRTKYEQRKRDLEAKRSATSQRLDEASEQKQTLDIKETDLQTQIETINAQISQLEAEIETVKQIIADIEEQLTALQVRIDNASQELSQIVVEIQNESRVPLIEKLFSGTIADGLKRMYYLTSLNQQAQSLISQIESDQKELEHTKQEQEIAQSDLETTQQLVEAKKSSLQVLLEQTQGEQAKYEQLIAQYQSESSNLANAIAQENAQYITDLNALKAEEARRAELQRQQQQKNNQNNTTTNPSSGTVSGTTGGAGFRGCFFEAPAPSVPKGFFMYPASGRLTNGFKCGGYNHDGLDIANGMGTALVAIANGTVVRKGAPVSCIGFSCNGGFGNYVIVEHTLPSGRNMYALYAHMQVASPLSIGQTVSKGQRVGSMGCTGNTQPYPCGVHLHFMMIDETLNRGISCIYSGARCVNPLSVLG